VQVIPNIVGVTVSDDRVGQSLARILIRHNPRRHGAPGTTQTPGSLRAADILEQNPGDGDHPRSVVAHDESRVRSVPSS